MIPSLPGRNTERVSTAGETDRVTLGCGRGLIHYGRPAPNDGSDILWIPSWEEGYDHKVYRLMAESGISCNVPPAQPEAPFCWRIMTPLLAKILPFDIQTNFLMLAFAAVWLTGVAVYYMTKAFNFSKALGRRI